MKFIIKWFSLSVAIFLLAKFSTIITITDTKTVIYAALALGLINLLLKPILKLLTLPLNIITLGIFSLVLNGFLLTLVPKVVSGFHIKSFFFAIVGAALIWIISSFINAILIDDTKEE